jgi:hypothetical protein
MVRFKKIIFIVNSLILPQSQISPHPNIDLFLRHTSIISPVESILPDHCGSRLNLRGVNSRSYRMLCGAVQCNRLY